MTDLRALIPDLPMKEYQPVGYMARSNWRKLSSWLCWGYRGTARRIWVNPEGPAFKQPLLVASEVEKFHCKKDAQTLAEASRPNADMLTDADYELTEKPRTVRNLRWRSHDLLFEDWMSADGGFVSSVLMVKPIASEYWELDDLYDQARARIPEAGKKPRPCINAIWRLLYTLAILLPVMFAPAIVASAVAQAIAPDSVSRLASIAVMIAAFVCYNNWASGSRRRRLRRFWGRIFDQGDEDGSVRRALASIGISLASERRDPQ